MGNARAALDFVQDVRPILEEQCFDCHGDVEKPIIKTGGRRDKAIAWMILQALDGYQDVLKQEFDFIDENVTGGNYSYRLKMVTV